MNDLAKKLLENLYDQKVIAYKHLEDLGLIDRFPMLGNVGYKINAYGVE